MRHDGVAGGGLLPGRGLMPVVAGAFFGDPKLGPGLDMSTSRTDALRNWSLAKALALGCRQNDEAIACTITYASLFQLSEECQFKLEETSL